MPGRRRSHEEELHREAEDIAIPENDFVAGRVPEIGPAIEGTDEDAGKQEAPGSVRRAGAHPTGIVPQRRPG